MPIFLRDLLAWANANQGTLAIVLFLVTLALGWVSGIFAYLRHKPAFRIRIIDGPTFFCTFGTGQTHQGYDVHRTGIALYLSVANVGSSPASIDAIAIGYRWAIRPFNRLWWRYGLRRFWLSEQAVILDDFQVAIGDNLKFYPFLVSAARSPAPPARRSSTSAAPPTASSISSRTTASVRASRSPTITSPT